MPSFLTIFAPAKINLYLHITGRTDNGYHTLDSLVNFADIGDEIHISAADDFFFEVNGPYAGDFPDDALKADNESTNLVVMAASAMAQRTQRLPHFKITLTKNLPIASGIGGGSSNAAAVIWGLQQWWGLPQDLDFLPDLFLQLGADVPVCYFAQPARMQGIGEVVTPVEAMPEMDVVLVNPNVPCTTHDVFTLYQPDFKVPAPLPQGDVSIEEWIDFLALQENDLQSAAHRLVPVIGNVLSSLRSSQGCLLHRLSGSGATCFGIFDSSQSARVAAKALSNSHPDWWIAQGTLNSIERY